MQLHMTFFHSLSHYLKSFSTFYTDVVKEENSA